MRVLVSPDSFKGSLDATKVAEIIKEAILSVYPSWEVETLPLADGGEGTAEILKKYYPLEKRILTVDATFREITSCYHTDLTGRKAFIESAAAIGLPMIPSSRRNPLNTSSLGLGIMIKDAITNGAQDITVALGGSATCDCGMGMMRALGWEFLDKEGISLKGVGRDLNEVEKIGDKNDDLLREIKWKALCDVENPLYGPEGAARVFAPQKGASHEDVETLDEGLKHFSEIAVDEGLAKKADSYVPGSGAAGGLGYAFHSFLNSPLIKGIDFILDTLEYDNKLKDIDLVITGEGKIDRQSLMGKVLSGVISKAGKKKIPVIAFGGKADDCEILKEAGLKGIYEIINPKLSEEENMKREVAELNIRQKVKEIISRYHFL